MKTLLTQEELRQGVDRLAEQIRAHFGHSPLTVIGVLTGSVVLLADVIRRLEMPLRVGVVQASSYKGEVEPSGQLTINAEMMPDIADRDVLLIDDIFDTGETLVGLISQLQQFAPRSIQSAVLLQKTGRSQVEYVPEFIACDIPDTFVVGYGLDYRDHYRNLPYLATLEPADLAKWS